MLPYFDFALSEFHQLVLYQNSISFQLLMKLFIAQYQISTHLIYK
jgi:hypothetical protein